MHVAGGTTQTATAIDYGGGLLSTSWKPGAGGSCAAVILQDRSGRWIRFTVVRLLPRPWHGGGGHHSSVGGGRRRGLHHAV